MNSAQPLPPFSKAIKIYETVVERQSFHFSPIDQSNRSMKINHSNYFDRLCGYTEYNQINHVSIFGQPVHMNKIR